MRTLLLLRHGKSDWSADYGADHDRPLALRGRRAARRMGRFLRAVDQLPDRVLASSAIRARTTVEIAARAGGWSGPIEILGELYDTGPAEILETVRRRNPSEETLLLAGHEPTWSGLVELLTGGAARMPTAALACIRLETETWSGAAPGGGRLLWLVTPKLLDKAGLPAGEVGEEEPGEKPAGRE